MGVFDNPWCSAFRCARYFDDPWWWPMPTIVHNTTLWLVLAKGAA